MPPGSAMPSRRAAHVDAIPKQIVTLCNDIAEIDSDPEQNALLDRHLGVSPRHASLDRDGAAYRIHDTPKLDQKAIAGRLQDAAVVLVDCRVDQLASQRAQPCQRAFLVRACQPAVASHV